MFMSVHLDGGAEAMYYYNESLSTALCAGWGNVKCETIGNVKHKCT